MQEVFDGLKFREFSLEEDAESVVDMHCCAEVLEGSWFDKAETCKMHGKIVVRSPGSSWVLAYGSVIFGHADLIKTQDNEAIVVCWRVHENYRIYPEVSNLLLKGLKQQARKRECTSLIIFADRHDAEEDLKLIGLKPDREYTYADISDLEQGKKLRSERAVLHPDDIPQMQLHSFLGSPLPPTYVLQKSFMASDYAVFRHTKPDTFEIYNKKNTYLACHDGREWHVFRQGNFKGDKSAVASVLKTMGMLKPGRIMLSTKAADAAGIVPSDNRVYHDFCCRL